MASITAALARVKKDYEELLSPRIIEELCNQCGHAWRNRALGPITTVHLFILQVLHGNLAINHLRRISPVAFSDTAYCQARGRLPLEVLTGLLRWVAAHAAPFQLAAMLDPASACWRGHRVLLEDGSSASMPDTPELQDHYGQPGAQAKGCGFPIAHLLYLMDYASGMVLDLIDSPLRTHDLKNARHLLRLPAPGDLILADRAFCSFVHLALILRENLHAAFRVHQARIVDFAPGRRSARRGGNINAIKGRPRSTQLRRLAAPRGMSDQVVSWDKPDQRPLWMSRQEFETLPATLRLRELRYRITRRGYRTREVLLVTTLLDPLKYPARELAELYLRRWRIEQNFRSLKTTMGMEVLRCRSVDGVRKELLAYAIAYNLVCLVMLEAATRQDVDAHRISFVDALRWLAQAIDQPLPPLVVIPLRPDRVQPRVVKRRPKEYTRMTKPRSQLIQELLNHALAA